MRQVVVSGDSVTISETNFVSWAAGAFVKPITNNPISGSQSRLLALTTFAAGAIIGGTVGKKYVDKTVALYGGAKKGLASQQTESFGG